MGAQFGCTPCSNCQASACSLDGMAGLGAMPTMSHHEEVEPGPNDLLVHVKLGTDEQTDKQVTVKQDTDDDHDEERNRKEKTVRAREEKLRKLKAAKERDNTEKHDEEQRLAKERREKLGELGKEGAKLQVLLETGWSNCQDEQVKAVRDQVAAGMNKFVVQINGNMYAIHWQPEKGITTQTHCGTKKERQLRVVHDGC
eukprot:TRINITY_DN85789_c0_g1_i1.p1 TRINITY_DN85789_c0_g1~~TRINITY_DN85789_c0_g1_i1.p1  ORF type:complete len:211 (+),score=37.44 TRINITY_DN85789_c0_g1_i1:39-635(+)